MSNQKIILMGAGVGGMIGLLSALVLGNEGFWITMALALVGGVMVKIRYYEGS